MGEVTSNGRRNFDLNMGPGLDSLTIPIIDETMILNDWSFDEPFIRHWHQQVPVVVPFHQIEPTDDDLQGMQIEPTDLSLNLDLPLANSGNEIELQAVEGSVAVEERPAEVPKACKNCKDGVALDKTSEKNGDVEKGGSGGNDAGFFDCNICFDVAKDPIVTCCGHLFCWPCIYTWLHMESKSSKGCPVCKGVVTIKSITPIYGRGNDARVHDKEEDLNLNIPIRPNARRIERHRLNLNLELVQPYEFDNDNASQGVERSVRRNPMFQREQGNSVRNAAQRLDRNQEHPPLVDDRDSFSSVAAVINSESQVSTGAENFLSTSSYRRRNDVSSLSDDVDSGDSPSPMGRRLN